VSVCELVCACVWGERASERVIVTEREAFVLGSFADLYRALLEMYRALLQK